MFTPPYRALACFAGNMATCVEAGVGLEQSLRINCRVLAGTPLAGIVDSAMARIRNGAELSAALDIEDARWPPFFIPLLQAGEETGRLGESLRYLEQHCKVLDRPARAVQNVWLIPLCILLAGTVVECGLYLAFRSTADVFRHLLVALRQYVVLAAAAYVGCAPRCKPVVDPLKLNLPFLGALERDLGLNRFFCALSMLYAAGGRRVESMIRQAARSVSNVALCQDLQRVAREIERGASVAESFDVSSRLTRAEKNVIATGELTGTLERAFEDISKSAGERVQSRLELFQQFSLRLTMFVVIASIVWTVRGLA